MGLLNALLVRARAAFRVAYRAADEDPEALR
jgi:hypothetical protein